LRAIVNMMSSHAAGVAGWRAREIRVDKSSPTIEDVLRSAGLKNSDTALYDLIADETGLKPEFALFVSGELLRGAIDWTRTVVDSEQIHVCDWPMRDS
jgi:hypothetical protein